MVQYDIRWFYEEPLSSITPDLIKAHEKGLRGKIIKLAHLMAPELAIHADVMSADNLLPDQRNAAAAAEMRRDMLSVVFDNNSLNLLSLTNTDPSTVIDKELTTFTAYCAAHRVRIKRLLNISVNSENPLSVAAARPSLREQLGLNATNKQNTTGKRTYALDAEVLATATAYAARYIARERARIADDTTTHPAPQPEPNRRAVFTLTNDWQEWPRGVGLEGGGYEFQTSGNLTLVRRTPNRTQQKGT